jgi:hypothetical protein
MFRGVLVFESDLGRRSGVDRVRSTVGRCQRGGCGTGQSWRKRADEAKKVQDRRGRLWFSERETCAAQRTRGRTLELGLRRQKRSSNGDGAGFWDLGERRQGKGELGKIARSWEKWNKPGLRAKHREGVRIPLAVSRKWGPSLAITTRDWRAGGRWATGGPSTATPGCAVRMKSSPCALGNTGNEMRPPPSLARGCLQIQNER